MPHIHLAMATKPPQLIKASFTFFKDYDIIFRCILVINNFTITVFLYVNLAIYFMPPKGVKFYTGLDPKESIG